MSRHCHIQGYCQYAILSLVTTFHDLLIQANQECILCGNIFLGYNCYSTEVIMFQWSAPKRREFLRYHLRRSRLVMMRSVGSDIRLSVLMSTVWNPSILHGP
ncbi:hypothetical protein CLU79DRAFT_720777 [Phycomyces nitens]|nr:hypothetical protein CLU79DRAFT_720777 [Phycomyces nitens]